MIEFAIIITSVEKHTIWKGALWKWTLAKTSITNSKINSWLKQMRMIIIRRNEFSEKNTFVNNP